MAESKLTGMRKLSDAEIQVMNEIADMGNQFGALIDRIEVFDDLDPDDRWLAIGRTYLQFGVMCLKRAIGKPDNF